MTEILVVCPMCRAEFHAAPNYSDEGATCPGCGIEVFASDDSVNSSDMPGSASPAGKLGDPLGIDSSNANASLASEIVMSIHVEESPKKTYDHNPRLAAIIGGSVVAASIAGIVIAWLTAGLDHVMRYMPDDMVAMMSVRYADSISAEFTETVKEELPYTRAGDDELRGLFGVFTGLSMEAFDKIERLWIGASSARNVVVYLEFKEDISSDRIIEWFDGQEFEPSQVDGTKIYESDRVAFCVVDSNAAVVGSPNTLKRIIKRSGRPDLSDGMKTALSNADMSRSLCAAINLRHRNRRFDTTRVGIPEFDQYVESFGDAQFIVYGVDITDVMLLEMTVGCRSEEGASTVAVSISKALTKLNGLATIALGKIGAEAVETFKVSSDGSNVTIRSKVDADLMKRIGEKYRQFEKANANGDFPLKF